MKLFYRNQNEKDWKQITADEVKENGELNCGLPRSWVNRLQRGMDVYTVDHVFTIDAEAYEKKIQEPLIQTDEQYVFRPHHQNEWIVKKGEDLEKILLMMNGYGTDYEHRLQRAELVDFPLGVLRLKKTKTCPICQFDFRGLGAVSRRDNATEICSSCANDEAMMDYIYERRETIVYADKEIGTITSIMQQQWENRALKPISFYLPKWVEKDFSLQWSEDLTQEEIERFHRAVEQSHYANVSEWLKEKVRQTLLLESGK